MTSKAPNILFILCDQMKWSALQMYSEYGIHMPHLEALAARGTRFETAVTPHPLCVPARIAMMTGLDPVHSGCRDNHGVVPDAVPHAFEYWKQAGYTTGLIGKNHCFQRERDEPMFDVWCELHHLGTRGIGTPKGLSWTVPATEIQQAHQQRELLTHTDSPWPVDWALTNHPLETYATAAIATQTERFLEDANSPQSALGANPFALWVSFPDPHEPYDVPKEVADRIPLDSVQLPPQRDDEYTDGTAPERLRVLAQMMRFAPEHEPQLRELVRAYQAMCLFIDDAIGRISRKLEELDILDNTIVVFCSDHGDFMGEHRMAVKGAAMYDCLVRVPLIVSWPEGGIPQGRIESSPVSTLDVLPTLLHLQGIPLRQPMDGRLLPAIADAPPRTYTTSSYGNGGPRFGFEELAHCEASRGYPALLSTVDVREAEGDLRMVRTERWKYVHDLCGAEATVSSGSDGGPGAIDQLYDLQRDPWELSNLALDPSYGEVIAELRQKL